MGTTNKNSSFESSSADNIYTKRVNTLAEHYGKWLDGSGKESDIVISSRVRLARNLRKFIFPGNASDEMLTEILGIVKNNYGNVTDLKDSVYIRVCEIKEQDRQFLMERRLISSEMVHQHSPCGLIIGADEMVSIMINEEDHLRIQGFESGLEIEKAWNTVSKIDDEMSEFLDYAYSDQFGYLTSCPTNTGTGLRISVFIHLPGIALSDKLELIIKNYIPGEITLRGFYGEGTEALGNIFQISNQLTLGRTESGLIERLRQVVEELIHMEREERKRLYEKKSIEIEDKIGRSYGTLKYAKLITSIEAINLISNIRFGVALKYIEKIDKKIFNELLVGVQPVHLQKYYGKRELADNRDMLRANFLRNKLDL